MITEVEVRQVLEEFPLYRAEHEVRVIHGAGRELLNRDVSIINYRTRKGLPWGMTHGSETTHFDLQIEDDTCYLVEIGLEPEQRGVGFGGQLYTVVENIARKCECRRVVTHPSGNTVTGETRKEYVKKRGYLEINDREVEKIL